MQNMGIEIKGNIMTIKVDLSKEVGESGSGKSTTIATTGGRKQVPGAEDYMIMCNIFKPHEAAGEPEPDLPKAPAKGKKK